MGPSFGLVVMFLFCILTIVGLPLSMNLIFYFFNGLCRKLVAPLYDSQVAFLLLRYKTGMHEIIRRGMVSLDFGQQLYCWKGQ